MAACPVCGAVRCVPGGGLASWLLDARFGPADCPTFLGQVRCRCTFSAINERGCRSTARPGRASQSAHSGGVEAHRRREGSAVIGEIKVRTEESATAKRDWSDLRKC